MGTLVIDAKQMCEEIKKILKEEVIRIQEVIGKQPEFVIINASDDESNKRYIKNKIKEGEDIGLKVTVLEFAESVTTEEIVSVIDSCVKDKVPVILQLPIYDHLDKERLLNAIDYTVDADGFTKEWIGKMNLSDESGVLPATPKGVINLLEYHDVEIKGKVALVIGKSNHVGRPIANLLMNREATVLVANKDTVDLDKLVKQADIIVSCVGKTDLVKAEIIKEGSVLIGVGFTYVNGRQILDFDVDKIVAQGFASMVSNRINCTGKATVNALISNVVKLYKLNYEM
jgi:methylenetetrahydrofolate dehydrogenase (NADP+)/methenyltetrahydrofolate cyclohydrolase